MTIAGVSVLFAIFAIANCQHALDISDYEKNGSCPPMITSEIEEATCIHDLHCPGTEKCCATQAGGKMCVSAVTTTGPKIEKPDFCPTDLTGPWVCSHMCSSDNDCNGPQKCCPNRCDALTCQDPVPSLEESGPIASYEGDEA